MSGRLRKHQQPFKSPKFCALFPPSGAAIEGPAGFGTTEPHWVRYPGEGESNVGDSVQNASIQDNGIENASFK